MTTAMVLSGPERRRRWTEAEKVRIVEESLAGEVSVAEVARRHDVHPNLLHRWRQRARAGAAVGAPGTAMVADGGGFRGSWWLRTVGNQARRGAMLVQFAKFAVARKSSSY